MIEEQGRVVAVEEGAVWVETVRKTACSGCAAKSGCGQGLMDRLGVRERRGLVRAACDAPVAVGDTVVIGIHEDALLRGSLLVYLFPLLALFGTAIAAEMVGLAEPLVIVAGLAGFGLSWAVVRRRSRAMAVDATAQPVVLRTFFAGPLGLR